MSFNQAREALNHLFHRRADIGLELASPVTVESMLALVAELVDILNGIGADRPIWLRRFEPLVFKGQTPSKPVQPFVAIICNELRFEALASRQEVWMRLARSGEDMCNWSRSAGLVHEAATLVLLCTPGSSRIPLSSRACRPRTLATSRSCPLSYAAWVGGLLSMEHGTRGAVGRAEL